MWGSTAMELKIESSNSDDPTHAVADTQRCTAVGHHRFQKLSSTACLLFTQLHNLLLLFPCLLEDLPQGGLEVYCIHTVSLSDNSLP